MKKRYLYFAFTILVILFANTFSPQKAISQTALKAGIFSASAVNISSGNLSSKGSLGQPVIDRVQSDNNKGFIGFWYAWGGVNNLYLPISSVGNSNDLNLESSASQITPNPVQGFATFSTELVNSGEVSVKVISMLGNEVANLYSGNHLKGKITLVLDATLIPNGYYTVVLTSNNKKIIKPFIVNK